MSDQETRRAPDRTTEVATASPPALLRCHPLGDPPSMHLYLLDQPVILLGRADECQVHIEDDEVSRRHAILARIDPRGSWRLGDCGSANGVFVDGVRVRERELPAAS